MASPNTGLFAASFIDGFLKQRQSQKERKDFEKINKLQAKLLEMRLNAGQLELDAEQDFLDALANSGGGINSPNDPSQIDAGIIPPPPDIFDTGLGRNFVSPTQGIPGQESSQNQPDLLATIVALQENPELLRDNPQLIIAALRAGRLDFKDLFGRPQQDTTLSRNIQAAGFQKGTAGFQDQMLKALDANADDDFLAQLVLNQQQEKLDEQRRKRELAEKTESEARIGRRQAVRNDFTNARRIIELQQDLEGTAFATGTPYGKFLRDIGAGLNALMDIAGFDVAKAKDLIAKRDELGKLFADGTLEAIDRFKGTGTITNQKFDALVAASPEIGKTAIANAQVLATRMRAALDAAERKSEIVPNRAEIEAWIAEMKSLSAQTGARNIGDTARSGFDAATVFAQDAADKARSSIVTASEIARMTIQELQQIDPAKITAEAREAARKRYNELYDAATK